MKFFRSLSKFEIIAILTLVACQGKNESLSIDSLRSKYDIPIGNYLIIVDLDRCDPCNEGTKKEVLNAMIPNNATLFVATSSRKKAAVWLFEERVPYFVIEPKITKDLTQNQLIRIVSPFEKN